MASLPQKEENKPDLTNLELLSSQLSRDASLIPLTRLLRLRGEAYSLHDHFPFEPMFNVKLPKRTVWKCGRQVAKTTSIASSGVLRCATQPYLSMLYVTPLSTQIRRLSSLYVKPFVTHSFIKRVLIDQKCAQTVFLREFLNSAIMHFSFAFLDLERVRGISCDWIDFDEVQDFDYEFLPIINECMSASKLGISTYTGTPKSLDNTEEALWQDSSQAEWITPCSCGYSNTANVNADLLKMIGKNTVVCAKCDKPINPRDGYWYHFNDPRKGAKNPQDVDPMFGYHVPQCVMPMHYENPKKWQELLAKAEGRMNYNKAKYFNEVLGESCDLGLTLVSLTDIKKACALGNTQNTFEEACRQLQGCKWRVMGIDWGGGGAEATSFTVVTLIGLETGTGRLKCFYCERFPLSLPRDKETEIIIDYFRRSNCHLVAHDYGGSGDVREAILIQAGMPLDRIVNIAYGYVPKRNIFYWNPPIHGQVRGHFILDKPRSLILQAYCIKGGVITLPEYESSKDVTSDLLNLIEERKEVPRASDIVLIKRRPKFPDDFAHSLNLACVTIWHKEQRWPDLKVIKGLQLTQEQLNFAKPPQDATVKNVHVGPIQ